MFRVFFKFNPLSEVLTFQIIYQYPSSGLTWKKLKNCTWHTLWGLDTFWLLDLKDSSFQNSIDWLGLYLHVYNTPWLGKISDLQCLDYWKTHLWNVPSLFGKIRLLQSPHVGQPPPPPPPLNKLTQKLFPLWKCLFRKTVPAHILEGDTIQDLIIYLHLTIFEDELYCKYFWKL